MKRRTLLLALIISATFLSGCKSNTTVSSTESIYDTTGTEVVYNTETESIAEDTTETATESNIQYGADTKFDENGNPIGDYTVYEDTNGDGVPDAEVSHNYEVEQVIAEYGSQENYLEYAKSQDPNVDAVFGYCWVYYKGQGAGNSASYCIDPRDGKRYEVGDTLPDGTVFIGATDEEWMEAEWKQAGDKLKEDGYKVEENDKGGITIYLD